MTKVAVFGDSFAANHYEELGISSTGFIKELFAINNKEYDPALVPVIRNIAKQKYVSWVDYLSKYFDVDNYGHCGSDLYYSFNKFVKHHNSYDKCIVVLTGKARYSTFVGEWLHAGSVADAKEKSEWTPAYKSQFSAIKEFMNKVYLHDEERYTMIFDALVGQIQSIRPDTIIIDAFPDNVMTSKRSYLFWPYEEELKHWGMTIEESVDYTKHIDMRNCHLTNENNYNLAEFIFSNIEHSGFLDLANCNWTMPLLEEKNFYFLETKTSIDSLLNYLS